MASRFEDKGQSSGISTLLKNGSNHATEEGN
jgi:hypothetical protein